MGHPSHASLSIADVEVCCGIDSIFTDISMARGQSSLKISVWRLQHVYNCLLAKDLITFVFALIVNKICLH